MNFARRLTISMLMVVLIACGATASIGGFLLWQQWKSQAENLAWQDIRTVRKMFDGSIGAIDASLRFTVLGERFSQAVGNGELTYLVPRLKLVAESARLDFLLVTDANGVVLYRVHNPEFSGDSFKSYSLVSRILSGEKMISGTVLFPLDKLAHENKILADQAKFENENPIGNDSCKNPDSALFQMASAAVYLPNRQLAGVLVGGVLLHRRTDLFGETENGDGELSGPYRTVFLDKTRITTNVKNPAGRMAFGTCVDDTIYDRVIIQGRSWLGKSHAAGLEYIAAYEPIRNIDGRIVGILGAGVPADVQQRIIVKILLMFGAVSLAGTLFAGFIGWRFSRYFYRPLKELTVLTDAIGQGDFDTVPPPRKNDEFKRLRYAFERMARSLKERDEILKERTRRQLTQSERLASVGRLAAGVAHEINNPLTGVLTFSHMLRRDAPEGSQQAEDLDTIIEATTRCKQIVRGLLDFSRQNEPKKSLVNLNEITQNAINLMRNQAKIHQVDVKMELESNLPQLVVDGKQLHDVIVNLIVNAIDAMPEGGQLHIASRSEKDESGDWLEIEVGDTGSGIPPDTIDHIFDPFFTTKPAGKGTGLGLAIAYGIVTEHGGTIQVKSTIEKGSTFVVRLPLGNVGEIHA